MTAEPIARPLLKARIVVQQDDEELSATLRIGADVHGDEFDPSPDVDLVPSSWDDAELSTAHLSIRASNRHERREYREAAEARILLAQFRMLQAQHGLDHPEPALLVYVAKAGREMAVFMRRLMRHGIAIAVLLLVAVVATVILVSIMASLTLFGSAWPSLAVLVAFPLAILVGSRVSVGDAEYRRPNYVLAPIGVLANIALSSYIVAAAIKILTIEFENAWLIWSLYVVSQAAFINLLMRFVDLNWDGRLVSTHFRALAQSSVTEKIVFAHLIYCAHSVTKGTDETDTVRAIMGASMFASALHQRPDQRILVEQARETLRNRGDKIAATIEHHATLLLTPGSSRQSISRSLLNGALSVYRGNWDNLAQIDPDTSFKSAFRRYAPRIITATLIAAAAFIVPTLSGLIPAEQAGYVRATLLLTALFTLFVSDPSKLRETALGLAKDTLGKSDRG